MRIRSRRICRLPNRVSGSAVAQSPINPLVLYAGYTDGALWVTQDGGANWTRIDENVGLPGARFVDTIEASRYEVSRVYVAFDGHRSDDDAPYNITLLVDGGQLNQTLQVLADPSNR